MTAAPKFNRPLEDRLEQPAPEVAWKPLPGSQELAVSCPCHHILYEGTRGPGKTDAQLMFFRKFVGIGYGRFWRGILFDREYKQLDEIVHRSKRWFNAFNDGARFLSNSKDYKWVWPSGEELLFRQARTPDDYWLYHGQEFPFIGWNELCKWPSSELYDTLLSCNRTSFRADLHSPEGSKLPDLPLHIFSTANPYGPGHSWVKERFIDAAPPGVVVTKSTVVLNPRTQKKEEIRRTQVRIFGSYVENVYLPPEYVAELQSIREENKRRAWLQGDWNIVAGGALDDLWKESVHILPRFKVPETWNIDRSLDWGSSKPFSVGWWGVADGNDVLTENGQRFCPVKGSLIRIHEYYGFKVGPRGEQRTNTGLKLSAKAVAANILRIENRLKEGGWIKTTPLPGPADNSIFDVIEQETDTIAKKMADIGVRWARSDKSAGSRLNGLQLLRDRLEASLTGDGPGIYWMAHCGHSIATLPVLPRDEKNPDDVDSEAEDHIYDETRYRVLAGGDRIARKLRVTQPH